VTSWRAAYRGIVPDDFLQALDIEARTALWRERLAGGDMRVVVAEAEEPLGFCAYGPTTDADLEPGNSVQVFNLHVRSDLRGQGVGRALLAPVMEAVAAPGRDVCLWVLEGNSAARRFYERLGLTFDGTRVDREFAPGVHAAELRYRGRFHAIP
jgi:ribosomal protein S18 acetylase RimI-like enzyme